MPKMIFVNLPVADVDKSAAFYAALGFTRDERFSQPGTAASMVWSDAITVMLLSRERFADFTPKAIADTRSEVQALFALSFDSREDVDAIVAAAAANGGIADPSPIDEYGWMYGRSFEDLDGHGFGPIWMDVDAALAAFAAETAEA